MSVYAPNVVDFNVTDPLAREILASEMGNACDGPTTAALAAKWETENRRAIVLPWEESEIDGEYAESYYARKKKFASLERPKRADLVIPVDVALFEYNRLKGMSWRDQVDKANGGRIARRINEVEQVLGLPVTDYAKDAPAPDKQAVEADAQAGEKYAEFSKLSADARLVAIESADKLLAMRAFKADPSDRVKRAALQRMTALLAQE